LTQLASRPFDLASGPMLRPTALRLKDDAGYVVLLDLHHIVTDGWSNEILLADLAELYEARREGRPSRLGPQPVAYGDFAAWQREWLAGPEAAAGWATGSSVCAMSPRWSSPRMRLARRRRASKETCTGSCSNRASSRR
jgi:hypothetical protein